MAARPQPLPETEELQELQELQVRVVRLNELGAKAAPAAPALPAEPRGAPPAAPPPRARSTQPAPQAAPSWARPAPQPPSRPAPPQPPPASPQPPAARLEPQQPPPSPQPPAARPAAQPPPPLPQRPAARPAPQPPPPSPQPPPPPPPPPPPGGPPGPAAPPPVPAPAGGPPGGAAAAPVPPAAGGPPGATATAPLTPAAAGGREAHRGSGGGTSRGAAAAAQAPAERRPVVFRAGGRGAIPRLEHPDGALHQPQSRRGLLARHHRREPDAAAAGVFVAQALDVAQLPRLDAELVPLPHGARDRGTRVHPVSREFRHRRHQQQRGAVLDAHRCHQRPHRPLHLRAHPPRLVRPQTGAGRIAHRRRGPAQPVRQHQLSARAGDAHRGRRAASAESRAAPVVPWIRQTARGRIHSARGALAAAPLYPPRAARRRPQVRGGRAREIGRAHV